MKESKYSIAVLAAGSLWGFMGLFRRVMGGMGFDSFGVILVRCAFAAICFGLLILIKDKKEFVVSPRDFWCFIGSGLCSLLFFSSCYFQAMTIMSLSAAAILLYTSPIFVILMSAVLFKEKITGRTVAAIFLAVGGCTLVSGIIGSDTKISFIGILYGLGSGFGYALYSIFGKLAMQRGYKSSTVNFYSCLLAALGAGIIWGFKAPLAIVFSSAPNLLFCALAGVVTCFLPYLCFTYGLSGLEAGKVSIIASIEPVVATLVGLFAFSEKLDLPSVIGIALVLAAIILTNTGKKEKQN